MFLRVRDFGAARRVQFPPSSVGGQAFATVAAAAAQVQGQYAAKLRVGAAGTRAKKAARAAIEARLTAIARTARLAARIHPVDSAGPDTLSVPVRKADVTLLTAAHAALARADAVMDQLRPFGLSDALIPELHHHVDAFAQAIDDQRARKTVLTAARNALTAAIAQGMDAAHTLDVIVANTLRDDPVELALWKRDRHVASRKRVAAVPKPS
jgi:hypothetical protein